MSVSKPNDLSLITGTCTVEGRELISTGCPPISTASYGMHTDRQTDDKCNLKFLKIKCVVKSTAL